LKNFRSILIVWGIVTIAYTVWSNLSYYQDETIGFHLSGGLFVAGIFVFAVGMFSHMGATGLFDGFMYGFKRNRRAKLKEIDPDYEEDEEAERRSFLRDHPRLTFRFHCRYATLCLEQ